MTTALGARHHQVHVLYHDHHRWLQGWLRGKLGNSFDADDLAHDTFIRLLARDELVAPLEPRAFLTTIAKGVVVNFYRRRTIEAAYLQALAALPEPQLPDLEERAILLESLIEIDRCLDGLAPLVRRVFLLSQLDGMTQMQIAAETGISLATVQRYIGKAMHQCVFERLAA
jgi:RNA polymerase sigma-70 factor (ECF subfamily)